MPSDKDPTGADLTQFTQANGAVVANDENTLRGGARGPVLLADMWLLEKHAHFNRERIPERVVHAKGSGAYGTFTVTHDITAFSKASLFSAVGKETPVLLRFSQVAGEMGYADTGRDVRGFAIKFYTEEGNWDLVGNNTPIFFVRDPMKFPDFIHSQKRLPQEGWRSPTMQWDFWSLHPESVHQVLWLMGDRGTPKSYRHMNGYGSHAYSLINARGQRVWVKFHFKTNQGIANFSDDEANAMTGKDPDHHRRDLFMAIEQRDYPSWTLFIQTMTDDQVAACPFDPFDLTKVWPHGDFPLQQVGTLELNTNPGNFFVDIEQAAFAPSSLVPGISYSPDPMLQARLFAYADTHRYRLGVNNHLLRPNQPRCPMQIYHRDGLMRADDNGGAVMPYHPNSFPGPQVMPEEYEPPMPLAAGEMRRFDHRIGYDDFSQPARLLQVMKEDGRERLIQNITGHMAEVPEVIKQRQLGIFRSVDASFAERLALSLSKAVGPAAGD